MAIFYFPCPFCQKEVKADTDWIGESCDCPYCDYSFLIPEVPGTEKKRTASQPTCDNTFFTVHCPKCHKAIQRNKNADSNIETCPKCNTLFFAKQQTLKQKIFDFFLTSWFIILAIWAITGLIGLYYAETGIERAIWIAPWVIFILTMIILDKGSNDAWGMVFFVSIIIGILLWFSSCCSSCRQTSIKVLNERMESEQNGHEANAWYYATVFVKKRLKAPSTADFEKEYVRNNGNVWEVGGFVDAQNGFGAKLRNGFYCKLEYNNKTWTEISTVIFE